MRHPRILAVVLLLCGVVAVRAAAPAMADSGAGTGTYAERAASILAPGANFTCWVDSGAAKCVGLNDRGQLGDGTTTTRAAAVGVTGLSSGVMAIASGANHACVLLSTGAVKCWGGNDRGQLGDGTTTDSTSPVQATGLSSGVVRIDAEADTTCAVTLAGAVKCWGNNQTFGTGTVTSDADANGEYDPVKVPTTVPGLESGALSVAVGGVRTNATTTVSHACAILQYGQVRCWGANASGQSGTTVSTTVNPSVEVALGARAAGLSLGGAHSCAVTDTGAVLCWGANATGQMGQGNTTATVAGQVYQPTGLGSGVAQIASNRDTVCVLTSAGGITCWGDNIYGIINDLAARSTVSTPQVVQNITSGQVSIAMGEYALCSLSAGGTLLCWGNNASGQSGDGYVAKTITPQVVRTSVTDGTALGGFSSIASALWTTCGVRTGGSVWCWGYNSFGGLGDGTSRQSAVPAPVPTLTSGVASVFGGGQSICAVMQTSGEVKCWGFNQGGKQGNGTTSLTNVPTPMLDSSGTAAISGVTSGSSGSLQLCVVASGAAKCMGSNTAGALGDGTTTARTLPTQVSGLTSGVAAVTSFQSYSGCALMTDGTVQCWGSGNKGEIGNGSISNSLTPSVVTGVTNAIAVGSGENYACALISDGTVKCWGANYYGQLGDGTITNRSTAVTVSGLSNVTAISVGMRTVCAIISGGTMKCWGWNYWGIFNDGTSTDSRTPVSAGITGVAAISQGGTHICVRLTDNTLKCWGSEQSGQLANNHQQNRPWDGLTAAASPLAIPPAMPSMPLLAATTTTATPTTTAVSAPVTPATVAPTTTLALGAAVTATTTPVASVADRVDDRTYDVAPANVGAGVALNIIRKADLRTLRLDSVTPRTCIAAGRSVITLSRGTCQVLVRSLTDGSVMKKWRTLVAVADSGAGSTIREAAPVVFTKSSPRVSKDMIDSTLSRMGRPRAVLVVGHTAILTGNSVENLILSRHRARNVALAIGGKLTSTEVSWSGVGGLAPVNTRLTEAAQSVNRRVTVYYVP